VQACTTTRYWLGNRFKRNQTNYWQRVEATEMVGRLARGSRRAAAKKIAAAGFQL
jgi:hypothetical protein